MLSVIIVFLLLLVVFVVPFFKSFVVMMYSQQQEQQQYSSSSSPLTNRSIIPQEEVLYNNNGSRSVLPVHPPNGTLILSPQESSYYNNIWNIASPDMGDYISGTKAAELLQKSGLSRNILHQIWGIVDNKGYGKINENEFNMICRLIAHMQSGAASVDPSLVNIEPPTLPIFDGIFNNNNTNTSNDNTATGTAGTAGTSNIYPNQEQYNINNNTTTTTTTTTEMRPKDAAELAMSMKDLGIDPLDFIPRTLHNNNKEEEEEEGPNIKKVSNDKWFINDEDKQKYASLFMESDPKRTGYVNGKVGKEIFEKSKLSKPTLSLLWELADQDKDGKLNINEFIVAMQLISKCKKGYPIPAVLPKSLQYIIGESIPVKSLIDKMDDNNNKSPKFGKDDNTKDNNDNDDDVMKNSDNIIDDNIDGDYWKYMPAAALEGSYSKSGNRIPMASGVCLESAIEEDKRLSKELTESIDGGNEELQHIMDMCGQLEVENARLNVDVKVKESQLNDLKRQTEEESDELDRVNKQRREVNLEQISLRRDRAHLEDEIKHLQSLLDDGTASIALLSQQQMQLQNQVESIESQTRQLDCQRREAVEEHKSEISRLREEQSQTSAIISDYSQLKRDEIETAKDNISKNKLNNELTILNTKPDINKYTNSGIERDLPPTATSGNRQWIDQVVNTTRTNRGVPSLDHKNKEQLQSTPKVGNMIYYNEVGR